MFIAQRPVSYPAWPPSLWLRSGWITYALGRAPSTINEDAANGFLGPPLSAEGAAGAPDF
jgi:hypothetical protein